MMLSVTAPHKTYQRLHFGVYINIVSKAAFRITITLAWLANITRLVGKSFLLQTVFMSALCKVQTQTPYCYCGYSILSFSFFYYVTFPHKSFYSLLLRGNERYRVEAATQFAECSQLESWRKVKQIRDLQNTSPPSPSVRDVKLSCCRCCDCKSISLRQWVTQADCSEPSSCLRPPASLQRVR